MRTVSRKGNYYNKLLMMFIVLACIPGLVIAASLYWLASGQIKDHLHQLHQNQIEQRANNIDGLLSYLEMNMVHWAFEPRFGERLRYLDFVYHFEQTEEINHTLLMMQGAHPLIRQTQLFLNREDPILFDPEYNVLHDEEKLEDYQMLLAHSENIFWRVSANDETSPYSFQLVHKIPGTNGDEAFGAIVTVLDRAELANLLQTLTPYNNGATFLMDADGNMLLSINHDSAQDEMIHHLQEIVQRAEHGDGSFLEQWGSEEYSVSFGTVNRLHDNWIYVSAAPMNVIISPVIFMSRLIFVICLAGLLFAGLLSWMMINRIYSPIQQLLQSFRMGVKVPEQEKDEFKFIEHQWQNVTRESQTLQKRLGEQRDLVKEGFLMQLLQGYLYSLSNEDLINRLKNYGWDLSKKEILVMHV